MCPDSVKPSMACSQNYGPLLAVEYMTAPEPNFGNYLNGLLAVSPLQFAFGAVLEIALSLSFIRSALYGNPKPYLDLYTLPPFFRIQNLIYIEDPRHKVRYPEQGVGYAQT